MLSAVVSFFFVRITWCVVLIFYFSPLRNSFVYTSRLFFYFIAHHLLKNIFHYASPYCVYSLARHLLRWMFQYTSRSWISNSMHVTCCAHSLIMRHGWFHSVRFHRRISFICLSRCPTLLHGSADHARRLMRTWHAATVLSVGSSVLFAITSWVALLNQRLGGGGMVGAYGQKQKKEGRHQKIETLTGERTRNR